MQLELLFMKRLALFTNRALGSLTFFFEVADQSLSEIFHWSLGLLLRRGQRGEGAPKISLS